MTIEQLCAKYHWASIAEDGALELFLDHHALSTYRMCEAKFELEILQNYRAKGMTPWSLNFGSVFHKVVEKIYEQRQNNQFDYQWLVSYSTNLWAKAELDRYREHKTYQALNGLPGFLVLLSQYATFYAQENERLRPIGVELAFGKGREVPLGEYSYINNEGYWRRVRCFLSGRIDFLMDSGTAIGPMDHKTKAFFKGNPAEDHDPQEGMTGYIFAASRIIKAKFPELLASRKVDRVWMNYVQVKAETDLNKRFKRIPIFKTEWQLEQYRQRQLSTFGKILDLALTERAADWNTSVCANTFHQDCTFKHLHKLNTQHDMLRILNNDFEVAPAWNPDTIEERDAAISNNAQTQGAL
jgi:hypothetical protein